MKFPWSKLSAALESITTPSCPLAAMVFPAPAALPPITLLLEPVPIPKPLVIVAQRGGAAGIRADEVPLDKVAVGTLLDVDAAPVGRDGVGRAGRGSADDVVVAAPPECHSSESIAQRGGAVGVRADEVPLQRVIVRAGRKQDALPQVTRDHVGVAGRGPADRVVARPVLNGHAVSISLGDIPAASYTDQVIRDLVARGTVDQDAAGGEADDDQPFNRAVGRGEVETDGRRTRAGTVEYDLQSAARSELCGAVDDDRVCDRRQGRRQVNGSGARCPGSGS